MPKSAHSFTVHGFKKILSISFYIDDIDEERMFPSRELNKKKAFLNTFENK